MKKFHIVLFFSMLALCKDIKAQDTLATIQTIVANKSSYIGGSFSNLLNHLPLDVKYFFPGAGLPHNRYAETSTKFSFYFPTSSDKLNNIYPCIRIYWQAKQNRSQSLPLYNQAKGAWSSAVASHYGSAIISNIELVTGSY